MQPSATSRLTLDGKRSWSAGILDYADQTSLLLYYLITYICVFMISFRKDHLRESSYLYREYCYSEIVLTENINGCFIL